MFRLPTALIVFVLALVTPTAHAEFYVLDTGVSNGAGGIVYEVENLKPPMGGTFFDFFYIDPPSAGTIAFEFSGLNSNFGAFELHYVAAFIGGVPGTLDTNIFNSSPLASIGSAVEVPVTDELFALVIQYTAGSNAISYSGSITFTPAGGTGGVPEPEMWALMVLGLGGVGAMMRRHAIRVGAKAIGAA